MSQGARVTSIDAIKKFRSNLASFGDDARNALGAVEMEIRRTVDWLLHDQPAYWKAEIKRRHQNLSDAQAALSGEEAAGPAEAPAPAEAVAVGSQPSAVSSQPEKTEEGETAVRPTPDG